MTPISNMNKIPPPYDALYNIISNLKKCIDIDDIKGRLIYGQMLEEWVHDHPARESQQEQQ